MRASTLFAITLAGLLGLGVAVVAKMTGLFNGRSPEAKQAPPAPEPEIYVLVGTHNLFAGTVIQGADIRLRPLHPEEKADYERNKDRYFPPTPSAAALRVTDRNIEADQPIMRDYLRDLNSPDPLKLRLVSHMRAVNVAVPKDRCVGGMIQVGDWVDVILRSTIASGDGSAPVARSANLAHNVRVIAKRNNLWPIYTPLPEDKPVDYTLEANPYRASLIEFAKDKGSLVLVPLPSSEQKVLEARRNERLLANTPIGPGYFSEPDSIEYKDEDTRVNAFLNGDVTLGEGDLVRIFGLKIEAPAAPVPPVSPKMIERYSGVNKQGPVIFPGSEPAPATPQTVPVKRQTSKAAPVFPTGNVTVAAPRFTTQTRFQFLDTDATVATASGSRFGAPGAGGPSFSSQAVSTFQSPEAVAAAAAAAARHC